MSLLPDSQAVVTAGLQRAVWLAGRGRADTANPQVGAVILDPYGRIIAEGWHDGAGTAHAEVAALAQLPEQWRAPAQAAQLTLLVTLEPCTHTGKTAPCVEAVLSAGIGRVVYGAQDPTALAGGGANWLRARGVQVTNANHPGCLLLLQQWQQRISTQPRELPYVVLKWAQTIDGFTAATDSSSKWITGSAARADVHRRRTECAAIAVGTGTLLADDPQLTARGADGELLVPADKQPVPVIFGDRAVPAGAAVWQHPALTSGRVKSPICLGRAPLEQSLKKLLDMGYASLFVEGGSRLHNLFLRENLVDELLIYTAPGLLGQGLPAVGALGRDSVTKMLRFSAVEHTLLGSDLLTRALVVRE